MNDIFSNTNLWLSIGASFVTIISAIVAFAHFLLRPRNQKLVQRTLSQSGQMPWVQQQDRGLGYHFGCVLKTIIIVVLIIAIATACTYISMIAIAVLLQAPPTGGYTTP